MKEITAAIALIERDYPEAKWAFSSMWTPSPFADSLYGVAITGPPVGKGKYPIIAFASAGSIAGATRKAIERYAAKL